MKKQILIVEYDNFQAKIFEKIFSEISDFLKCEVVSIARGEDAIEHIKYNVKKIGVVILDLALPDISGFEVIAKIKDISKEIPIIILSATENKDLIVEAMKRGATSYFVKGAGISELEKLYVATIEAFDVQSSNEC
jgi:DNA-binding NtrC family response regulator